MRHQSLQTIILIAACALSAGGSAQTVYKCGNTYSQLPCPDGVVINTADPRTPEQKAQSEAATRRDALAADALEKARIEQEKRDLAARPPVPTTTPAPAAKPVERVHNTHLKRKKHKHFSDDFIALVPSEKKRKSKNSSEKHSRKS